MQANAELSSENACSYAGIVGKTIFFLLVTVAGVLLCFILHNLFVNGDPNMIMHVADEKNNVYDLTFHVGEGAVMFVVLLISIIVPFLAWFLRKTVPITGTIYCAAQGMLIGYITVALSEKYKFLSLLAMIITLALVAAMLFVYAKKIIKVTARFRGVITAIFGAIVLSGIIFAILSLIPAIRNSLVYSAISGALNNPVISIIISIVFVIIAALFMLADFDTIQQCVEGRLDKSYEWMAAWGLAYTILYIYFKILRILIMIFGRGRSNNS